MKQFKRQLSYLQIYNTAKEDSLPR